MVYGLIYALMMLLGGYMLGWLALYVKHPGQIRPRLMLKPMVAVIGLMLVIVVSCGMAALVGDGSLAAVMAVVLLVSFFAFKNLVIAKRQKIAG